MAMQVTVENAGSAPTSSLHIGGGTQGAPLSDTLRHAGTPINTRCGQRGLCESCVIELVHGAVKHVRTGEVIAVREGVGEIRQFRACEFAVCENHTRIRLPARALLTYKPQVLDGIAVRISHGSEPLVGTKYAVAVDIGTTTVAVMLVEPASGRIASRASAFNAQMHLGDDVVTRISLCTSDASMLAKLQVAIVRNTLVPLVKEVLSASGASAEEVGAMVIAGNTTMLHILANEDPSPLGVSPFTPRFLEHRVYEAGKVMPGDMEKLRELLPACAIHLLPGASAYVGSDIVAGVITTAMQYDTQPTMLVDVGTNGEIVLQCGEARRHTMLGTATAAGPAFEGARLASGMRAGVGAITDIHFGSTPADVITKHIGQHEHAPVAGMCGSAYIDFLAEAKRTGLLDERGRFDEQHKQDAAQQDRWVAQKVGGPAFRVAWGQGKRPVVVSEMDVASIQSAKAAIYAGIRTLLEVAGMKHEQIARVYLAGGFGTHMNAGNAIKMGMLGGFLPEQIVPVGNTSLAGAYLAVLDQSLLGEMKRVAGAIEPVELNKQDAFQDHFVDGLML